MDVKTLPIKADTRQVGNTNLIKRLNELESFIGNTFLYPITKVFSKPGVQIFAKLEWLQLGRSVKARPAFNIIKNAVKRGELHAGKSLLDATSGNTGIAYASICKELGIPVTLCVPENISNERKAILKNLGVDITYTSKFELTDGAQEAALCLYEQNPGEYYYADQYENDDNWRAHYNGTAVEIYRQTHGKITHFVAGLGTTGTFVGTGRGLKELNKDIQLISLQPDTPLHGLEGWKHLETALVPKIYDNKLADADLTVSSEEAYDLITRIADEENLQVSPSSAANLVGAIKVANEIDEGIVVTVFPDNADKYNEVINTLNKACL